VDASRALADCLEHRLAAYAPNVEMPLLARPEARGVVVEALDKARNHQDGYPSRRAPPPTHAS
jgi:hypothetical protein